MANHLDAVLVRLSDSSFFRLARKPNPVMLAFTLVWIVCVSGFWVYGITHGHISSTREQLTWMGMTTWALIFLIDAFLAYTRHYLDTPLAERPHYVRTHLVALRVTWRTLALLKLSLMLGFVALLIVGLIHLVH